MEAGGDGDAEEEQVMSEVHLGCPPRFSGLYLSRFTFSSLPLGGSDGGGCEMAAATSSSCDLPDAVAVDNEGDLVLERRRRKRDRRRSDDHVLTVQHGITSSLNSVGLQVWKAAMLLTDFVLHKSFTSSEFDGVTAMEIGAGTGLVGLVQARVASKVFITAHCRSLMRSGAVSGVSMKLPPSSREKKKTTTTAAMTGRWEGNCPAPWSVGQWESAATPPPLPMARASRVFFPPHEAQTSALRSSSPVCFFFIASGSTCAPIWPRAPHGMPADLQGSSGKRQGPALDLRDRGTDILDNCLANVRLNSSTLKFDEAKIHIRELDWKTSWPPPVGTRDASDPSSIYLWAASEIEEAEKATLLLAADVIYSDGLTDLFFDTVRQLMSHGVKKVLYLTLEKRYNFSLDDLDVVANGYKHFQTFFAVQDGCGVLNNAAFIPGLVGERIDLGKVPQYIREYDRGEDLEMWKLMYCFPD